MIQVRVILSAIRRRQGVLLLYLLAAILLLPAGRVRAEVPLENQVKGAFVLNFMQFVDWPEGTFAKPDDPIVIGVLDKDPMDAVLMAAVEGKTVKGHKVVVSHFTPDAIGPCQLFYLSSSNAEQTPAILKAVSAKHVLSIGDADNFSDLGGVIRFYLEDRKERFEINLAAAERAKLKMSSKLLKLAKVVNK